MTPLPQREYEISTETAQEMVARSHLTLSEIARRMGFVSADTQRLRRLIGLRSDRQRPQTGMTYATAVRLCEAVDADPVDYGL